MNFKYKELKEWTRKNSKLICIDYMVALIVERETEALLYDLENEVNL